ncbi:cob(I)alamin adenolsyltransferase/cobinamide ATP-dependent adenolsyltransferase [Dissulfurispira thermophila]|uniref:corrinoid adenosyltransferase n=2 Tax=root TaxID=1 RepID=A0A7G1H5L5_9BACT|nr:cob(I)yrinic acid a,c-diamide adenosyltransferase [Dissulfurispira thermophila]BCB97402.1 cob(I)alamin adenolsyltransferase/cobinamide ATP-dependent adenolsyltransferase [Dissulfurispira thermophila]
MRKGYIQVYTGNSKGKTTAALGLALRAAGAGFKVFIAQFIKKRRCSEHKALERFKDLITVKQYGTGFIMSGKLTKSAIDAAQKGFEEVKNIISSRAYDMVILDEINVAIHSKLLNIKDIVDLLNSKPQGIEIILTGRYADKKIIEVADLVTEMKEIKHYYKKGVKARRGIEH